MLVNAVLVFFVSLIIAGYSCKKLIFIAHKKQLFDEPDQVRKIHKTKTPTLGGIGIFISLIITTCLLIDLSIPNLKYVFLSGLLVLILGIVDDLTGLNANKKFFGQIVVALIISVFTDNRISNFYFIGAGQIPFALSVLGTTFFIVLTINAFNLIDGINYLAGTLALIICIAFSLFYREINQPGLFLFCIALCGCLLGFLFFNRTPAKIFMGDAGSMCLGFIIALLSIRFIGLNGPQLFFKSHSELVKLAPQLVLALLAVPLYDTLRVFSFRILRGRSPFVADRNHLHHRLLQLKLSHLQATLVLVFVQLICLITVWFFPIKPGVLYGVIVLFPAVLDISLWYLSLQKIKAILKKVEVRKMYSNHLVEKNSELLVS